MGQVKTPVRLTNVSDLLLDHAGQPPAHGVHTYTADALIDTGATRCVLPVQVADQLGRNRSSSVPP